jgi:hypothetical protein
LWHKKLGHISIDKIKRLINNEIFEAFDFTDFSAYVNCIKVKKTNKYKKDAQGFLFFFREYTY